MARDPKVLRKAYEAKLGKNLADQLTNEQIGLISKYYNSLSDKESSEIDSQIVQGRNNTELHEMAESLIAEKNDSSGGTVSVYKPENKFADDKIEELDEKLEKTSDKIMDAIDELIAADKKRFEDFKKKSEQEVKGKFQYEKPIGPQAMQGPKQPPKKTVSPEKDEDWEGEVPDQLDGKLDDVLDQIRNEPLPQPTKTKRRKTKGKKALQRKSARIDAKEMGVGESLTEIMKNIVETREALFDLYKVTKARFEFKKKIDKKLTGALQAKLREKQIEKPAGSSDENLKPAEEKEDKKKKKNVIQQGLIASLVSGAVMLALPLVIEGLRPFITRDRDKEGDNQWWDFLDVFPNEIKEDLEKETPLEPAPAESPEPAPAESPEPAPAESPEPAPAESPEPAPTEPTASVEPVSSGESIPQTPAPVTPIPARDTSIPGDSGYKGPSMPMRAAATGGKFTGGQHKPLTPLTQKPKKSSLVTKLTKPLSSVVTLPQKAAAAGVLSFANSIISPFSAFLPESGRTYIQNIYSEIAKSTGLSGMKLEMGGQSDIFKKIKDFIDNILNSLMGTDTGTPPGPGEYYGPGFGPRGPADFSGNDNAEKIFNFYRSQGFTPEQAAGFVGNYDQESTLNPKAVNSIGATGVAQWLGSRKSELFKYAKDNNADAMDLETQLKFSMTELQGSESGAMRKIKKAKTAEEAALAIRRYYERPGEHEAHDKRRISSAKQALKDFNKPQVESPTGQHTVPLSEMPDKNSSPVDAKRINPPPPPPPPSAKPKVDLMKLFFVPTSPAPTPHQQNGMSMFPSTQIGIRAPQQTGS
jgi:hypothetical protein